MVSLTCTALLDIQKMAFEKERRELLEAAEFSERVATKLADPYFPPMDKGSTLEFGHFIMPPADRLRCARLQVEEEMDEQTKD